MDKNGNKTGGRAKGTPNKVTATARAWVASVIDGNREQFVKDLATLEAHQRIDVLLKLLRYVMPPATGDYETAASFEQRRNGDLSDVVLRVVNKHPDRDEYGNEIHKFYNDDDIELKIVDDD